MNKLQNLLGTCLLIIAVLCSGCFKSKNVVSKIPPADGKLLKLDGVPYALPRTVVQVKITVKRTDKAPGQFGSYAPCFFSKDAAAGRIMNETKSFSIEPPTFTSRGEPDPAEHYIAKIKGGYFENKTMLLEFNQDGVITKGEATSENTAIDVAIKAARATVSAAASIAKGPSPGSGNRRVRLFDQMTKLTEGQIDICRGQVVAEAASLAADAADAAAKRADAVAKEAEAVAAANPGNAAAQTAARSARMAADRARAAADEARAFSDEAEKLVAAAGKTLADASTAFEQVEASDEAGKAKLEALTGTLESEAKQLITNVVYDAKQAKQRTVIAASYARPYAADEADAADKAAARIDDRIKFIGSDVDQNQAKAFANNYLEAKKQYEHIVEMKNRRESLVSAQSTGASVPADTLKSLIEQADAGINTYQNTFFLGTKSEDSWTANFEFVPGRSVVSVSYNTQQNSPALLLFSKSEGLCETPESNLQGVKIKDNFKASKCPLVPDKSEAVWLTVFRRMDDDDYLGHMAAANARDESKGERGFYYRIPATATVILQKGKLTKDQIELLESRSKAGQLWRLRDRSTPPPEVGPMLTGSELGRDNMKVAQLGVTASIPASAAGRKTQYTIDFDEKTGAMKNFKLASNALLEKSIVDEAAGAVNDVIGAKQARDKAKDEKTKEAAEANDPLTQKKRELELLKTQNEINAEKKKLEESQGGTEP